MNHRTVHNLRQQAEPLRAPLLCESTRAQATPAVQVPEALISRLTSDLPETQPLTFEQVERVFVEKLEDIHVSSEEVCDILLARRGALVTSTDGEVVRTELERRLHPTRSHLHPSKPNQTSNGTCGNSFARQESLYTHLV